jgi:hypothetical protein
LKTPKRFLTDEPAHIVIDFDVSLFPERTRDHTKLMKLTTLIIDQQAETCVSREPIYKQVHQSQNQLDRPHIPSRYRNFKERGKTTTLLDIQHDRCSFHLITDLCVPGERR